MAEEETEQSVFTPEEAPVKTPESDLLPEENAVEESDENSHSTTTVKFMFAGILVVINGVLCT